MERKCLVRMAMGVAILGLLGFMGLSQHAFAGTPHNVTIGVENLNTGGGTEHSAISGNTLTPNAWHTGTYTSHTVTTWNSGWTINVGTGGSATGTLGNGTVVGNLNVGTSNGASNITMIGTVTGSGTGAVSGTNNVTGAIVMNGNSALSGTNNVTGTIDINGSSSIAGNNTATGNATIKDVATIKAGANVTSTGGNILVAGTGTSAQVTGETGITLKVTGSGQNITVYNANIASGSAIDATSTGSTIVINNQGIGTPTKTDIAGGTMTADKEITINTRYGTDVANISNVAIQSNNGNIYINHGSNLTGTTTVTTLNGGVYTIGSYYANGVPITSAHEVVVADSSFSGNNTLTSQTYMTIDDSDFGDVTVLDAGGDLTMNGVEIGLNTPSAANGAKITSGGDVEITDSDLGEFLQELKAGGKMELDNVTIGDMDTTATNGIITSDLDMTIKNSDIGANALITSGGDATMTNTQIGAKSSTVVAGDLIITDGNYTGNEHVLTSTGGEVSITDSDIGGGTSDTARTTIDAHTDVTIVGTDVGDYTNVRAGGAGTISGGQFGIKSSTIVGGKLDIDDMEYTGTEHTFTSTGGEVDINNSKIGGGASDTARTTINAHTDVTITDTEIGDFTSVTAGGAGTISGGQFGTKSSTIVGGKLDIDDMVYTGNEHTFTSTGGEIVINDSTIGGGSSDTARTTIDAHGDLTITGSNVGQFTDMTGGGKGVVTNSVFGTKSSTIVDGDLEITNGTYNGNEHTFESTGGKVTISDSDIGGGTSATDITSIKADEEIAITDSEVGRYAEITGGKEVTISGTDLGGDTKITSGSGGDVTIQDSAANGSTLGANSTVVADGKFIATGPNTEIKHTYDIDAKTGIELSHGVTVDGKGTMDTVQGPIDITGAILGDATAADKTVITTGGGAINIDMSSYTQAEIDAGSITKIGSYTEITTGAGPISIAGATKSDNSVVQLETGEHVTISSDTTGAITIDLAKLGNDNQIFNTTGGDIKITSTSVANDSNIYTQGNGHITVSGSSLGERNNIYSEGDGNITVNNTTGGNGNNIYTEGTGNIKVTNSSFQNDTKIYTDKAGDLYLENTSFRNNAEIYSALGGDVYINNVQAGPGSEIRTDAGANNTWQLRGNDTDIQGDILMKGTIDTATIYDHGKYNLIQNTTGEGRVIVRGGHTDTIENISATAGTSWVLLDSHLNTIGGGYDQVVKHITGSAAQDDVLQVTGGARFTEYASILHNNPDNPNGTTNAQVNSITEYQSLTVLGATSAGRTGLEIGTRDTAGNDVMFEVENVLVKSGADLFIHQNSTFGYKHKADTISTENGSVLWIDRTSITSVGTAGSNVYIGNNAMITGYSEHADKADFQYYANIEGDLTIAGGAILKPYSVEHYNQQFLQDTSLLWYDGAYPRADNLQWNNVGVGMIIDDTQGSGTLTMQGGSILASRIFASDAGFIDTQDEDNVQANHADYVKATNVDFGGKAVFRPTFGNDNELGAKQQFQLYTGDGTTNENTYYYSIVRSDTAVNLGSASGTNIADNTMFNEYIVKSDMLGEWNFEMNKDGTEVLVRYRLLAKHPTMGGIAADMTEPNAHAAAQQIDRIRYPFDLGDLTVRYDGDMEREYREQYLADPSKYPNYKDYYIQDFKDLLGAIQEEIKTGALTNEAVRRLHPEPYADLAQINFGIVDQFRGAVDQHSISSLFMVEQDLKNRAFARAEGVEGSANAYASLDSCGVSGFVQNPIRFWAGGFGSDGTQDKVGTEYGYDTELWGGAVGVVKEWRDFYVGATLGYARADTDWTELQASAKTDAYIADLVVGLRRGMAFFEAYGNYTYSDHTTTRNVVVGTPGNPGYYSGIARGEYHDNVYSAGVRMGYQMVMCDEYLFVPTIGVNYISSESGKFTETGRYNMATLLDFRSGDIARRNVRVPLMGRLSRSFVVGDMVMTPEVRGAVTAIMGNKRAKATTRFVGDPSGQGYFTAVGVETGRWAAQLGASLELSRKGRFTLTGNYDYTFAKKSHEHNYSLIMGMNF